MTGRFAGLVSLDADGRVATLVRLDQPGGAGCRGRSEECDVFHEAHS
jgi:hypothetical protein